MGNTLTEALSLGTLGRAREEILNGMDNIEMDVEAENEYRVLADTLEVIDYAITLIGGANVDEQT